MPIVDQQGIGLTMWRNDEGKAEVEDEVLKEGVMEISRITTILLETHFSIESDVT